jgi:hypothetical protein
VAPLRLDPHELEDLLVERHGDDVAVTEAPAELVALLQALGQPTPWAEALLLVRRLGDAEPGEDAEILASLVDDGLLRSSLDS